MKLPKILLEDNLIGKCIDWCTYEIYNIFIDTKEEGKLLVTIKEMRCVYHLTHLDNLDSIIKNGLLSRDEMIRRGWKFRDVADKRMLQSREKYELEKYVPFHFFPLNPFDERVQKENPGCDMIYLALQRSYAEALNYKIIPRHPMNGYMLEIYDYTEGYKRIEWDVMEKRDYYDHECKQICMAECLTDKLVNFNSFVSINVKDERTKTIVTKELIKNHISMHINVTPWFFIK